MRSSSTFRLSPRAALTVCLVLVVVGYVPTAVPGSVASADSAPVAGGHVIRLKSRHFQPSAPDVQALREMAIQPGRTRVHILLQLDFIPRQAARDALAARSIELLAYVPDYAWIASVSAADVEAVLRTPGVVWAGPLLVEDKLAPAIVTDEWGAYNLSPSGVAAVYVVLHRDEGLDAGRALVQKHGGRVTGEVRGLNALLVEMPQAHVRALAAEDAVQWIEPAAPPLGPANDGIREQIGVNAVQAAPYSLSGAGVDILIYDTGIVTPTHPDFGGRLIFRDGSSVQDHSTHVAGVAAGSGSLSISAGGTALQWRGMAPQADVISYGYQQAGSGMLFYDDPGDIEANWAAAQNTYGADVGNASLSSNIYLNSYPCARMGDYGLTSALMDQIVRGGNSVVGLGDKYIATWAAGNERPSACSGTGYSTTSPPAGAKNPIHVGASNTNDNSMTTFSSWGPTDDGRIKPFVVAGGGQVGGDGGIKSTVPSMYTNFYSRNCDGSGDDYCYPYDVIQGTSMAAPAIAGSIALMLEHYRAVYHTGDSFWPSTARAILMQTARDFGNPGPDYQWGYGQVDVRAAVDLISRKAFVQESVAHGDVDTYYFVVPSSAAMVAVSLAWDDYEATLNASPALVNDLNLELVSPSGMVWRPWVLNPASPANSATRGIDSVNNQEQVQVPAPEVGTWLVYVRGTTVPQGPQDYTLACEGCKPLDLGVCQAHVSGTVAQSQLTSVLTPSLGTGERWQRSLEYQRLLEARAAWEERDLQEGARALESALVEGPQAVVALLNTLTGRARNLAMDEIVRAQQQLADAAPPPREMPPVDEVEEWAALERQAAVDAAGRELALRRFDNPAEGRLAAQSAGDEPALPLGPAADLTVGNGCTYASISAAVTAANPGDRLLIEGGRTFFERVTIPKNLMLQGGYSGCASGSSARTIIDGSAGGSVIRIEANLDVTLENLNVTNGSYYWGSGIWVGQNADLAATNVAVYGNVASQYGGGVRLFGGRAAFSASSAIYNNVAPLGGGVYASKQGDYAPALSLSAGSGVYSNDALSGEGRGGGVYMEGGSISLAGCSSLYQNDAIYGGGAYAVTSTLTIEGTCSRIESNTTTRDGGGVYAQNSTVQLDDGVMLYNNDAGIGGVGSGGGAYLDNSALTSYSSLIGSNEARDHGGGVYAVNGSQVNVGLGGHLCLGAYCSTLSYNTASYWYGGAVYASGSTVSLGNTRVENNTANIGGGVYAAGSTVSAQNTLFARNNATGGTGDGVRLYASSTMSGTANTLAYNDAGGAATGQAIGVSGSTLALGCSIIWGHSSSIGVAGQSVTYSDVQGGYAGVGNLAVDPLFVSQSPFDYHLSSSSPVIDRCLGGPATDLDGEVRPIVRTTAASPYDMGADEVAGVARVGVDGACTYTTIQQAVNAADDGDVVRVAAGIYFETIDIGGKDVAVAGGYNSTCTAPGAGVTRVEGSGGSGSTVDVTGGAVTLRDLQIAWGSGTGGGLDARDGAQVTLENTDVLENHASVGGGIYVDPISAVTLSDGSVVSDNTATATGGGAWVAGWLSGYGTDSDVSGNCASDGGGLHISGGVLYLDNADVVGNEAAGTTGKGGGVYVSGGGTITLTNSAYVGDTGGSDNTAYDGGGIYADGSTVYLDGPFTTVRNNTASRDGGGVYLSGSSILRATGARVGYGTGNRAQDGAGLYLAGGTQAVLDGAVVANNICQDTGSSEGGGAYVTAGSVLSVTNDSRIEYNQAPSSTGGRGGGMYVSGGRVVVDSSQVVSNTAGVAGGGVRLWSGGGLDVRNGSSISHNGAGIEGGGIAATVGAPTIAITSTMLHHNTAGINGGAIYLNEGVLLVERSAFHDNQATAHGGAIAAYASTVLVGADYTTCSWLSGPCNAFYSNQADSGGALYASGGTLRVDHAYLHRNLAAGGGAIFQEGAVSQVYNTLIYSNTATAGFGAGIGAQGGVFTLTHVTLANNVGGAGYAQLAVTTAVQNSIAWGNTGGGITGTLTITTCNIDQSGNAGGVQDPQFVSPGAGEDYRLLEDSPAVDACTTGLPRDVFNVPRPVGGGYDMGAHEYFVPSYIYLPAVMRR